MVEWSCTKERINERGLYNLVEWLCTKERINGRGPYILVELSCAHKRNKSVGTLILNPASLFQMSLLHKCFTNILPIKTDSWFIHKWNIGRKWVKLVSNYCKYRR